MRYTHKIILALAVPSFLFSAHAAKMNQTFSRDFWSPKYHGQSLNYCTLDNKSCGMPVAKQYCSMMGYQDASYTMIANNVGLTNFISSKARCKNWRCDGFKLIRCTSKISHKPAADYYYRYQRFALPRINNYRMAWCSKDQNQGCGKQAAYSFCRQMGYMKTTHFNKQSHVPATQTIGDQKLCFGNSCQGFKEITCFR